MMAAQILAFQPPAGSVGLPRCPAPSGPPRELRPGPSESDEVAAALLVVCAAAVAAWTCVLWSWLWL